MSENQYKSVLIRFYLYQLFRGMVFFSAVLVPFFTQWGGISLAAAQGLQSWFTFCIFILEVPTGVVADLYGRKTSVTLGCISSMIGALVYGSYPHIAMFVLGEFLFALGVALTSGADKAYLYDTLAGMGKANLASRIWGKAKGFHLLGIALGAPLGSIIASYLSINSTMLLTSVTILISGVMIYSLPEPRFKNQSVVKKGQYLTTAREGLTAVLKDKKLMRWAVNSMIVSSAAYFVIWLYQPLMGRLGIPILYFGLAHTGLAIVEMLIAGSFSILIRLFGSTRNYLNFSMLATAAGLLLAAVYPSYLSLIVLIVFSGGFGLTRAELMMMEINKFIECEKRATTLSYISMIQRISLATLNPVVGFTTDKSLLASLALVGSLPFLTFFVPVKKEDQTS